MLLSLTYPGRVALRGDCVRGCRPRLGVTRDRGAVSAWLMFVSSDRTGLRRRRDSLTWASVLPIVAAKVLSWPLRSLYTRAELGYGPWMTVRIVEHWRSLRTNEIIGAHICA